MTEPTFTESVNRHKVLIGCVVTTAIGWGTLTAQQGHGKDKDIDQDRSIAALRTEAGVQRGEIIRLSTEQRHFNDTVNEIKENQKDILDILRAVEMRLP